MAFTSQTFSALEQPTLAKWNILNSNDDDLNARLNTIETLGWVSYTPTLTNLTVGNGTLSAKYMRQSKICTVRFVFTFGTTSSMGTDPTLSLPFTSVALAAGANIMQEGVCALLDQNTGNYYYGYFAASSTTTRMIRTSNVGITYPLVAQITSTVPMTWANLDQIAGQFTYDIA
jgi:hypothetical protein